MPAFTSKKIDKYCEELICLLKDENKAEKIFLFLTCKIAETLQSEVYTKEAYRTKKFTDVLINRYKDVYIRGTVKKIIPNNGYGYIERKGAQDIKFKLENTIGEISERDKVIVRFEQLNEKKIATDIISIN